MFSTGSLLTGKQGSAKTLSFVFSGQKQYASRDIKLQVDRSFCYSCSVTLVSDSVTPWATAHHASLLSFTISWSLLKLIFIELVMPSNHLILCHPLFLLPSIFPSIRVFSNELALCIRRPTYWNFTFNISPANEYSGLISFRTRVSSRTKHQVRRN